ncbi:hypothetical protein PISMIDRAFT_104770 [Pisolithus microcarpus 441]|uniref:Cilia- and flagella-associated protein 43 n=1 Tax=Pisolithus microcarpus 441 TaxID=765257 RepID=A0A0C9ZES6_9AGAM|nr:hypothetical protein PISMIDRAFT_104770 [Pisolithus microcarpus 441]
MAEYGLWWSLEGHCGPINCLTFMEDGTHIASGDDSCDGIFEWLHMETVFDTAIEFVELDHTHNLLLLTTQGRIILYQIQRKNSVVALRLVQAHPSLSHPCLLALPISTHFVQQAHGVIVAFLDSRELGSTAYHEGTKTLLVWNLVDGVDVYQLLDCSFYFLVFLVHFGMWFCVCYVFDVGF